MDTLEIHRRQQIKFSCMLCLQKVYAPQLVGITKTDER